jgi:hypothetical protein
MAPVFAWFQSAKVDSAHFEPDDEQEVICQAPAYLRDMIIRCERVYVFRRAEGTDYLFYKVSKQGAQVWDGDAEKAHHFITMQPRESSECEVQNIVAPKSVDYVEPMIRVVPTAEFVKRGGELIKGNPLGKHFKLVLDQDDVYRNVNEPRFPLNDYITSRNRHRRAFATVTYESDPGANFVAKQEAHLLACQEIHRTLGLYAIPVRGRLRVMLPIDDESPADETFGFEWVHKLKKAVPKISWVWTDKKFSRALPIAREEETLETKLVAPTVGKGEAGYALVATTLTKKNTKRLDITEFIRVISPSSESVEQKAFAPFKKIYAQKVIESIGVLVRCADKATYEALQGKGFNLQNTSVYFAKKEKILESRDALVTEEVDGTIKVRAHNPLSL